MIIFLGDIHQNFEYVKFLLKNHNLTDCTIIQVGDFGAGVTKPTNELDIHESLNSFLKDRNIIMYAIRGNHDDPSYFKGNHIYSNLKLLEDYTILDIEDERILFIGGAISIDRKARLAEDTVEAKYGSSRRSYWFDEVVIENKEAIDNARGITTLVTHTAPEWCIPVNKTSFGNLVDHFSYDDDKLKDDLREERKLMSKIFDDLQKNNDITNHFYGHFHRSDLTINGNCKHRVLGINELYELKKY